jgi:molybdopterin molybdotransferase
MHRVADAQRLILEHAQPLPAVPTPLGPAALGRVLGEDVLSDLDMPPYDKALMDGYAVRAANVPAGGASLEVVEEVTAGQVPQHAVGTGQATRIMTGAPIPAGADAVVMVEHTRPAGRRVAVDGPVRPGQHVLPRAREMRRGEAVLRAGHVLRAQELGMLATVGRTSARLVRTPAVAILSTGNEVVEPDTFPGPGQIRNSNGPMLLAQATHAGASARYLGIARDSLDSLRPLIATGLEADVLVLCGGVSAGKLDLVPTALGEAGVTAHVHQVALKPGKPFFFGTRAGEKPALVFGLPGNPVSSLVCFELFVRPALRRLAGLEPGPPIVEAALLEDFALRSDRPTYHPAALQLAPEGWQVRAVAWFGSADLRGLCEANALIVFPPGDQQHRAGQLFPVVRLDT